MIPIGSYPLVVVGVGVVIFGGLVAALARMFGVGNSEPVERRPARNLTRLSLAMGLTLVILGLAIGPH